MVVENKISNFKKRIKIIRCPDCRGRLCDYVQNNSLGKNTTEEIHFNTNSQFLIKCHKCGRIIGLSICISKTII